MSIDDADQQEQRYSDIHQMIYRWDLRHERFGLVASSFDDDEITRQSSL